MPQPMDLLKSALAERQAKVQRIPNIKTTGRSTGTPGEADSYKIACLMLFFASDRFSKSDDSVI